MDITIRISDEAAAALAERASSAGASLADYAADIVERTATAPRRTLREISGPLGEDFRRSGMSEGELGELLEDVKHEARDHG